MPSREYASFNLALPKQQLKLREESWEVTGSPDPRLGVTDGDLGLTASLTKASVNGWVLESVLVRDSSPEAIVVMSTSDAG